MAQTDMTGMTMLGGSTTGGMMKPWLHFTMGDGLFFMGWVPLSKSAVVGACIGLFMLAIVERWVAAMRGLMHAYWSRQTQELLAARFQKLPDDSSVFNDKKRLSANSTDSDVESLPANRPPTRRLSHLYRTAPFIPAHDFARGALFAGQAALGYALMLAVMTFHAGYIIAIVAGLGVGEVLFGRFGAAPYHH